MKLHIRQADICTVKMDRNCFEEEN